MVPLLLVWLAATGFQDVDQGLRDGALAGQVEAVRSLLAEGAPDLDAADGTGGTALMYAVEGGHDEIVEMLLAAGASLAGSAAGLALVVMLYPPLLAFFVAGVAVSQFRKPSGMSGRS